MFLLLEIISNFILLLNYKYQFVSFKFYIGWNSLAWGLPTYILLRLSIRIIGKIAETKLIFFAAKNILYKNTQPRVFFCLFTIYHMIYRHTLNKVHHMWQLLISFKWKINLVYFKINILFHTPISETISNSNVTMAAASLSTIELNYFNNAIFSAINRTRHILKQRADINRVLNKI